MRPEGVGNLDHGEGEDQVEEQVDEAGWSFGIPRFHREPAAPEAFRRSWKVQRPFPLRRFRPTVISNALGGAPS